MPIIVHSRSAENETFELLKNNINLNKLESLLLDDDINNLLPIKYINYLVSQI